MSLEIAWKQNILVTDSNLLKSLLVVFGFGSQTFICGFSRQNICSVSLSLLIRLLLLSLLWLLSFTLSLLLFFLFCGFFGVHPSTVIVF